MQELSVSKGLSWLVSFNLKKLQDRFDVAYEYEANEKICEQKVVMKRNRHESFIRFWLTETLSMISKCQILSLQDINVMHGFSSPHISISKMHEHHEKGSHKNSGFRSIFLFAGCDFPASMLVFGVCVCVYTPLFFVYPTHLHMEKRCLELNDLNG